MLPLVERIFIIKTPASIMIYSSSGSYLYKINANNGNLIKKFGDNGSSDVGIVQIPPVVYKNDNNFQCYRL